MPFSPLLRYHVRATPLKRSKELRRFDLTSDIVHNYDQYRAHRLSLKSSIPGLLVYFFTFGSIIDGFGRYAVVNSGSSRFGAAVETSRYE